MAAGNAKIFSTNDQAGSRLDYFTATVFAAGTLNGSAEGIVGFPPSGGNGWKLVDVILACGVNGTHADASLTATVEKNTDGGTSALATAPVIAAAASTGRKSTGIAGTGITAAVVEDDGSENFEDTDVAFVTMSETGSAGTDPSDVSATLVFVRKQDFDPNF